MRAALWTLRGKKLAALGLAFKGDTDDIRDSPAIERVKMLLAEGCSIVAFDPAAMDRTRAILPESDKMRYANDAYEAAEDADAVRVLTDWNEFGALDLNKLRTTLRYAVMVDGRNMYDPATVVEAGFTYYSVGRPAAHTVRETVTA